jgi:hypothetical protein
MFNFRSLAEMVGVNIDDGQAHRQEGEEGDAPAGTVQPRPLSQVKEDDMEEAEAEHVEGAATTTEVAKPVEKADEKVSTPELKITPETPAIEGAPAEYKRLGETSIKEQPPQTT